MSPSFMPQDASGHIPLPLKDSWLTQDGARADLLRGESYPVTAVCYACCRPIRLGHQLQAEWRHVPAAAPAAGWDAP